MLTVHRVGHTDALPLFVLARLSQLLSRTPAELTDAFSTRAGGG